MSNPVQKRLHAFVSGRVQGVGFRYFVRSAAQQLSLVGWVRNLRDGRVELVAEGEHTTLADFLAIVRRGPSGAKVTEVIEEWSEGSGEFDAFRIGGTV